jgi:hypothetical protein
MVLYSLGDLLQVGTDHCSILPRVYSCIEEEDITSRGTVHFVGPQDPEEPMEHPGEKVFRERITIELGSTGEDSVRRVIEGKGLNPEVISCPWREGSPLVRPRCDEPESGAWSRSEFCLHPTLPTTQPLGHKGDPLLFKERRLLNSKLFDRTSAWHKNHGLPSELSEML